jgi:hypothetical protein
MDRLQYGTPKEFDEARGEMTKACIEEETVLPQLRAENVRLVAELEEARKDADQLAERVLYHNRGTTHYEGCEENHPDCKALWFHDNYRKFHPQEKP